MKFKEYDKQYNHLWGINSSESYEEAFHKFKQRILNIFQNIKLMCGDINTTYNLEGIDDIVTEESALNFCQYYSIPEKREAKPGLIGGLESLAGNSIRVTIIDRLRSETNEQKFYKLIGVILNLNTQQGFSQSPKQTKQFLIKKVTEAIEMSNVNVAIGQFENGIILYPKGEKKLDEELINKPLSFLNKGSNEDFQRALEFYQSNNTRESAENLRHSLENFLRYKLGNKKNLKKNIQALQEQLKKEKSQPEIRNIIFQTFNYLDKYFNEYSKHGNNVEKLENKFLIYQVGLLMVYINEKIQGKRNKIERKKENV